MPIVSNQQPCSNDGLQVVPIQGQRQSAGKTYDPVIGRSGFKELQKEAGIK